jgi:anti-anti-sigma regulatory factor
MPFAETGYDDPVRRPAIGTVIASVPVMAVRITTAVEDRATLVSVAGRLTAQDISELEKACSSAQGPLLLDLSDLLYADDAGVGELRYLETKDAKLLGTSPYIRLLLHGST